MSNCIGPKTYVCCLQARLFTSIFSLLSSKIWNVFVLLEICPQFWCWIMYRVTEKNVKLNIFEDNENYCQFDVKFGRINSFLAKLSTCCPNSGPQMANKPLHAFWRWLWIILAHSRRKTCLWSSIWYYLVPTLLSKILWTTNWFLKTVLSIMGETFFFSHSWFGWPWFGNRNVCVKIFCWWYSAFNFNFTIDEYERHIKTIILLVHKQLNLNWFLITDNQIRQSTHHIRPSETTFCLLQVKFSFGHR